MRTQEELAAFKAFEKILFDRRALRETAATAPRAARAQRGAGKRFQRRSDAIVAAAIPILNEQGFKGMRLVEVAERIGLKSTGITYYFPRKEDLAVACIEHGVGVFHEFLSAAEGEVSASARVRRLVREFTERDTSVRRGEATALASFAAVRALDGAHREYAMELYTAMFQRVRQLFDKPGASAMPRHHSSIRALILLEQLYWASDWLSHYDLEEMPRLTERMSDVMLHGLSKHVRPVDGARLTVALSDEPTANEDFMRAATREINLLGYRGASIDRISASLNLTKGAFYHHHDAKDELVRACFGRTFDLIRRAQHEARGIKASEWERLAMTVAALVRFQLSEDGPLLRTSALSSLPGNLQAEILELSYRAGRTFSSMISDAIAEGSVRAVDSTIAAYMLAAGVNAAAEIPNWGVALDEDAAEIYVRVLLFGLLVD